MESCRMSLFCEEHPPSQYLSIECLRAFLILPWLDAFVVNVTVDTVKGLHLPFAMMIRGLSTANYKILGKYGGRLAGARLRQYF